MLEPYGIRGEGQAPGRKLKTDSYQQDRKKDLRGKMISKTSVDGNQIVLNSSVIIRSLLMPQDTFPCNFLELGIYYT